MAPGALDASTEVMLDIAASVAHGREDGIPAHTTAARSRGMTAAEWMKRVAVVGRAAESSRRVAASQVPVDEALRSPT